VFTENKDLAMRLNFISILLKVVCAAHHTK